MNDDKSRSLGMWFSIGFVAAVVVLLGANIIYLRVTRSQIAKAPDKPNLTVIANLKQLDTIQKEIEGNSSSVTDSQKDLDKAVADTNSLPN